MALLDNDKMAKQLDMVVASKEMLGLGIVQEEAASSIVQEEAASKDNNVGEASGMVGEAFEAVGQAFGTVGGGGTWDGGGGIHGGYGIGGCCIGDSCRAPSWSIKKFTLSCKVRICCFISDISICEEEPPVSWTADHIVCACDPIP